MDFAFDTLLLIECSIINSFRLKGKGGLSMKKLPLIAATVMSSLMLAACGNNSSHHSAAESHTSSSKVVKSKKKTTNKKKKQAKQTANSSSVSSSATSSSNSSSVASTNSSSSTSSQQHSNIQLGLGDVAVWTDANGVTHHVDSDGMDRQNVPGKSKIQYADWSGPLPANATVQHNGN